MIVAIEETEVVIAESAGIMEIEMIAATEAEIEVSAKGTLVSSLQKVVMTRWIQESW
jgi:hypothetical protein